MALWILDLQSELIWSGDTGGTEASGATRRLGVDFEGRWEIAPWLFADLDVSLAHSRYKVDAGNGDAVALAPPVIVNGGLTVRRSSLRGSLRARHIGARPASQLTSDDAGVHACTPADLPGARCYLEADGYTVFDAVLAWETPGWLASLSLLNLTNAAYREAQFGNASQLPGEPHPVQDIHFTPGDPLTVQVSLTKTW
jgi:outer membrane receptor protein involved in Fe transport